MIINGYKTLRESAWDVISKVDSLIIYSQIKQLQMKTILTAIVIILLILTIIVWDRGYEVWLKFYLTMLGIVCVGGIWLSNQPPNDNNGLV